jgi:hypothetical protein
MSQHTNKKHLTFEYALPAVLLAAVALLVFYRIQDYDFFWHVASGKAMVQQGRIINEEIFSYTRPGTPFSNHAWLAQVIFYLIFSGVGPLGIVLFKTLLVTLLAFLLFKTARFNGADSLWSGVLAALVIFEGVERYRERTEIFSFLFMGLMGFILFGCTSGRLKKGLLCAIPVILVLWDFLHGALYGVIYLACFVGAETIKHFFRSPASAGDGAAAAGGRDVITTLWITAGTSLAALLINPYGIRSYDIFFEFLRKNPMVMRTAEFAPPTLKLNPAFWCWFALTVLLAVLFARKSDLTRILIMVPFAILAFKYRRVTPFFGLASIPAVASYVAAATAKFPTAKWLKGLAYAGAGIFIGYIVFVKFIAGDGPYSFGYGVNGKLLPVGSTRFISQSQLKGNMYNPGHFGGYLAYYLYPQRRIFLYNHHVVFGDFPPISSDPALVNRYGIEYAVLDRVWDDGALSTGVFMPARWALVFWDDVSLVVVRRDGVNAPFIAANELRYFTPAVLDALAHYRTRHALLDRYESNPVSAVALAREISSCLRFYGNRLLADYLGYLALRHQNAISNADALDWIESALACNESSAYLWYADSRFRYRAGDPARAEQALRMSRSLDNALVGTLEKQAR